MTLRNDGASHLVRPTFTDEWQVINAVGEEVKEEDEGIATEVAGEEFVDIEIEIAEAPRDIQGHDTDGGDDADGHGTDGAAIQGEYDDEFRKAKRHATTSYTDKA